ncbi:MAG: tyrosine-type recombinase/integrase [Acidobacteriota bacterium]|nr:tyrosine-type recombinase/integrase [Acidobacteriota bacterium]
MSSDSIRLLITSHVKRGRERGQNGTLQIVGKTRKRWRGHYWVYEIQPDGRELRKHKSLVLGFRSEMTRQQAKDALRQLIVKKSELRPNEPMKAMTFGQFWRERFLPMYEQKWKASSRATQVENIERYCVQLLDGLPLSEIERFKLQMTANRLAEKYSRSVVSKFMIWSRAILEEAVEQDFLSKNPARKLVSPETKPENKRFLALDEIPLVLSRLPFREELILRMTLVLGLRPGELFALRWDDVVGYALRLDESTIDGQVYPTLKTKESCGFVALPASLRSRLVKWREVQNPASDRNFIFPNADGGVYRVDNYRADVLKPALKKIADETGIRGIDFRACRRTCATHLSQYGGIKEVQAHLRHARATTTLDIYIQEIPVAVRQAVEKLDEILGNTPTDEKEEVKTD